MWACVECTRDIVRLKFTCSIPDTHSHYYVDTLCNFISEEAIRHAILFENACNPVVRTTSEIVLQIATEQNATRLAEIRRLHNCHDSNGNFYSIM